MGVVRSLLRTESRFETVSPSTLENPSKSLKEALGAAPVKSGVAVNEQSALRASAVWACVRVLSETVASLPLVVYRRVGEDGKERDRSHTLYDLLHDSPNPEMTSFEWIETSMAHLCLAGNAYSEIVRVDGEPVEFWPQPPNSIRPEREPKTNRIVYRQSLPDGGSRTLQAERVLHVRGLATNGLVGLSPIRHARESIGLALAAEEFGARLFGSGTHLGGIVEYDHALDDEQLNRFKQSIREGYSGLHNAYRLLFLEQGLKFHQTTIAPEEAQFLESRKFQITDIARIFRVPPHLIGDLDRSTNNNIEHQSIEFVVHTVRPWLIRWEQAIRQRLFGREQRQTHFAEFIVDALLRGDIKSRYDAYAIARNNGWMNADEIRARENMNPMPGDIGKIYLQPLNMIPLGTSLDTDEAGALERAQRSASPAEMRAVRSATGRRRTALASRRTWEKEARRIVKREVRDIQRLAEKHVGQRDASDFLLALRAYYRTHEQEVADGMRPLALDLGERIQADAAEEIGASVGLTPELEEFIAAYAATAATRHVISSQRQLEDVVSEAQAAGLDILAAVEKRLSQWEDRRPAKIAIRETVQLANAVSKETYRGAGIQKLRWVTFGQNCPFCSSLDGKVVGIDTDFVRAGESLEPDGADGPLTPSGNVGHAPLHNDCDCMIASA